MRIEQLPKNINRFQFFCPNDIVVIDDYNCIVQNIIDDKLYEIFIKASEKGLSISHELYRLKQYQKVFLNV